MKNDKKLLKSTAILMLVVMIALILVSGTYAKYTSTVSGTDTAVVAKWQVKLDGKDVTTKTDAITFDLFGESGVFDLGDADITNKDDLSTATGEIDEDVAKKASGETDVKVAPGTWGKVAFKVENLSDVTASYTIKVTALNTTLPLKFSKDGQTWTKASEITTPYELSAANSTLGIGSTTATNATVNLFWKWDFEDAETGSGDTALGAAGTAKCSISAGVTFTQVD